MGRFAERTLVVVEICMSYSDYIVYVDESGDQVVGLERQIALEDARRDARHFGSELGDETVHGTVQDGVEHRTNGTATGRLDRPVK